MRVALISTLGFEEKFCYRAILRHGIKEGDRIILFTAELVDKVERAYDWIRRLVHSSYGDSVRVDLIQLDPNNPVKSIRKVREFLDGLDGFKLIVNLSGGMRAIVIYVLLACMMELREDMIVEVEAEDLSGSSTLDSKMLKLVKEGVRGELLDVLKCVADGSNDVNSIAKKLRKDKSTVRRQLSSLERIGLIRAKKRKPLTVELSELSELVL